MSRQAQKRILLGEALEHRPRLVGAAVVDDNDFVPMPLLGEDGRRLLHEQRQILRFVFGGDEDGDVRGVRLPLGQDGGVQLERGGCRSSHPECCHPEERSDEGPTFTSS